MHAHRCVCYGLCSPSVEDAHLVLCSWTAGHWYGEIFLSSSSIKLAAILAHENGLIILLFSYRWSKQTSLLCRQSKSSIYHSQDKRFFLCILPISSLLSKLQTPPCCEASFIVSQRYLRVKELCWHPQHPVWLLLSISLLSPAFFFLPSAFTVIHQQCPIMVSISCLASLAYVSPLIPFLIVFVFTRLFRAAFPTVS